MFASGFGASSKILNLDAAGFPTHESSQVLLVSVHNIIYPITEYVLHRVFDPYGYVEKMDILQSSELLQAIVQFDSCQNAIWAKNQLQGRYIYERCCQLDIQFYKKIDNENQTENILMENKFASDLGFIRNKLNEMMVITERMQDRIKAMNSSSLFRNAAANSTISSFPSDRSRSDVTTPIPTSLTSLPVTNVDFTTPAAPLPQPLPQSRSAAPTQIQAAPQQTSPPSLSKLPLMSSTSKPTPHAASPTTTKSAPLFSPSVRTKTGTIIDVKQLSVCYGQQHVVLVGFKTPQSPLEISIIQLGKISSDSLHGPNLYGGIKMQFDCQTSFARIEQYGHILFDVMLERDAKRIFERTMFIFDPGGDIFDAKDFLSIWSNHVE